MGETSPVVGSPKAYHNKGPVHEHGIVHLIIAVMRGTRLMRGLLYLLQLEYLRYSFKYRSRDIQFSGLLGIAKVSSAIHKCDIYESQTVFLY